MDMDWTPSDFALVLCFGLAFFLALYFALGRPRTWYRDRLGWVIFSYAVGTVAFVGLIVYGIVFGQKVVEPVRFVVGSAFAVALALKIFAIHQERARGRLAGERSITGRKVMSTKNLSVAEIAPATTIWYKAQRVARTAVATLISSLGAWAGFVTIFPQISAELAKILPGSWITWLTASVAAVTVVASAITGIMAIPKVNAFLTKWLNLGSVPKSAIAYDPIIADIQDTGVHIVPDPKDASRIGAEPSPIEGNARG